MSDEFVETPRRVGISRPGEWCKHGYSPRHCDSCLRADADRLAAAAHAVMLYPSGSDTRPAGGPWGDLRAALVAHDAFTGDKPNGFAIEDECDADD